METISIFQQGIGLAHISDQRGRGVVALENIEKDTIVERAAVLVIPAEQYLAIRRSPVGLDPLQAHTFTWRPAEGNNSEPTGAIAFGLMSFCNHETDANAAVRKDFETECIELIAQKRIAQGTEIVISYATPALSKPNIAWGRVSRPDGSERPAN